MRFLFFTGLVFLSVASVFAQSQIGAATLNGTVTDPAGAVIAKAKVTATEMATHSERATESNGSGLYNFAGLSSGNYELVVEAVGFKTAHLTGIGLTVGAVADLDIHLVIGTSTEIVSVTEELPIVETTRSQISTTIDSRSVSELPVNGRNFLSFATLTPGVVLDPTRSGDLSFGGQRGTANSVQVDGTDTNNSFFGQATGRTGTGRNPYSFSQDSVKEFQVSTGGYAAEVGRAGGGIINAITKSGTNELHGSVFEFFRDRALNANTFGNNRFGTRKGNYHYNQFGATVGGPIKKNKIFFFFDYDGQRNNQPVQVLLAGAAAPSDATSQQGRATLLAYQGQYPQSLINNVYLGKVDMEINDRQHLAVRYNANRFQGKNYESGGSTSAPEHTGDANVTTDNIAANHTWMLSPIALLETRVSWTRDNEPGGSNSTNPEAIIQSGGQTVISLGRNSFSPRYTNARTIQWVEGLSITKGNHSIKFGVDSIFQTIGNYFPGNFSGSYTFSSYADFANNKPSKLVQAFPGAGTDGALTNPNVNEFAFYVQDSWHATKHLTLNYGVRYDLFDYAQPKVKNPDPGLAAAGLDTSHIHLDKNNFGPRFGFAYQVGNDGKTVLRGGWGMYYGRTPTILTGTAFSQNGIQVQTYTLTANLPVYPAILTAPPTLNRTPDIYVFAPDYVQPLTHQFSFNIERQLGKNYALTLGYLGVRGEHLTRTRDINLYPEVPVQGTIAGVGPVTFLRHPSGRPNPAFGRISLFDSGADSIYHGGFVQVTKRLSQNFQFQTSYTFSKVIDSRPDFTSVVVGSDDSKNPQDTTSPNSDRGRGNADVNHRFVFSTIWDINYAHSISNPILRSLLNGFQVSWIANLQSGRPLSASVGSDPNNDGNTSTDRPPSVGRNTFNGPEFMSLDARVTRDVPLGSERVKLRLIFEAFNATNRANFTNINQSQYTFNAATFVFTPTTNFQTKTLATSDPRILQLAGKITF